MIKVKAQRIGDVHLIGSKKGLVDAGDWSGDLKGRGGIKSGGDDGRGDKNKETAHGGGVKF